VPEYRPIELLKTATDLCTFDAICVGGTLHGQFRSLGSLPFQHLTEVIESHAKSRVGELRSFPYRLGSHMKYRLCLVRRGRVYLAWLHDSVHRTSQSELVGSFDAALEFSKLSASDEEQDGQAPFKHGDFVVPNGGHVRDGLTVHSCFHRDGKWWFIPSHGNAVARDCNCWVKFDMHAVTKAMDEENENAAPHATPDPKHKVLSDAEMFGPTQLFQTTNNNGENVTYGIDWSKLDLMSYASKPKSGPEYAASFLTNRTVAPPPDPQPLGRRPRRNIIRKERPQ